MRQSDIKRTGYIAVCGPKGSGKSHIALQIEAKLNTVFMADTFALKVSYAQRIKKLVHDMLDRMDQMHLKPLDARTSFLVLNSNDAKEKYARKLYQDLTEVSHLRYGDTCWADIAHNEILRVANGSNNLKDYFCITDDLRYPNYYEVAKASFNDSMLIYVQGEGSSSDNHYSEQFDWVKQYPHLVIDNRIWANTHEQIDNVIQLVRQWRIEFELSLAEAQEPQP